MKFILNEYHRNLSDKELLADLVATAAKLQKKTVSCEEYSKYGKYHHATITRRFGSWLNALEKAGLKSYLELNNWCTSLNEFVEDVKNVAQRLNKKTLTTGEYKQFGKYHYLYPFKRHEKKWNDVLKLANLEPTQFRLGCGKEISNEELFDDIAQVWIKLGKQPTITDIKRGYFRFSQNTFCRRFGGWRNTLIAFMNYINSDSTNTSCNEIEKRTEREISVENKTIRHKGKREPSLRMRYLVLQRDHFKCCICGRSPSTDPSVVLVVDHKHPWAKGGETTCDNLQTLCKECNLGKSDLL